MCELDLAVLIELTLLLGENAYNFLQEYVTERQNGDKMGSVMGQLLKEHIFHINRGIFLLAFISFSFFNDILWEDLLLTLILSLCPGIFHISCENW